MAAKIFLAIKEEDNSINTMAETLGIKKADVILMGLNLLNHVLNQRKNGQYLTFSTDGKTSDILVEATGGTVALKIND